MALTLSKTGITTGGTVEAYQVTQSIDALTGTAAYDIVISGSLTITGSLNASASYAISSSRAITSSYALNSGNSFPYTGSATISGSLSVTGLTRINGNTIVTGSVIATTDVTASSLALNTALTVGVLGDNNNYIQVSKDNGITTAGNNFTPANMSTPDAWQIIKYTDNGGTTQTAYIPVYYTT
jgi:hypothetical protein